MSNKLVSVVLLIFIFLACTMLVYVYNGSVRELKEMDLALERVEQSVLSTDGEVSIDDEVIISGYDLKQSIRYVDSIGSLRDILGKGDIYGDIQINNNKVLNVEEVSKIIDDDGKYRVSYDKETGIIQIVVV